MKHPSLSAGEISNIQKLASSASESAIRHRRALHAIPEVGLELPRTVAYIKQALRSMGLSPKDCAHGIIVDIGNKGPLVALRADMDALPIQEETGAAYASTIPFCMHACGHDAHAGILLATAEALAKNPPADYRVRLIFQAGEEGAFGARYMIESGCLEGVRAIVGAHVGDLSEEIAPGQAGFLPGPMMAASDRFEGSFNGVGGHGCAPHQTKDPIPALAQFILATQVIRGRRVDQRKPLVISMCQVNAGTAFNIIPEKAEFKGTVRTLEPADRAFVRSCLEDACRGSALAGGVEGVFSWLDCYPPVRNDPEATGLAMEGAAAVLGSDAVVQMSVPSMGGEDFSYYLEKVPGCFWFLNTQCSGKAFVYPNHNSKFDVDESLFARVIAVNLAAAALFAKAYA